ncbi:cytochrome (ubi)quinol oxidase subunit III [Microaerobacter geothermalis]|uniref:cytochrome (ubi)quinol oxidase subunit III n=1 Tax=Microaerobacter geothermalis TaxID=674972 RepID=UPI001F3CC1B3|nr:cytochrome (ubi)quinol oxidase subunit III [Microaerobacter geothermalis]MCF6093639.1 cytochrome (ubi)quinol oxidase subunit III [Microaerobacter geothermalis]
MIGIGEHVKSTLPPEPEKATLEGKNKFLAFWFFLGGETVLFGSLFAVFLALRSQTLSGPGAEDLFRLPVVFLATIILLTSSMTSVLAIMAMHRNDLRMMQIWFLVTVVLGLAFLGLEVYEFAEYLNEGLGYTTSAFASAFYTLVGFHGAHVLFGVLWISTLLLKSKQKGINVVTAPKYFVASLYWHFVDVVWVFIFTVVYLMGKVG